MKLIRSGSIIGVFIGLTMSCIFSYMFADGKYYPMNPFSWSGNYFYSLYSETTVFLIAIASWVCLGILFIFAGKVYQREDWSVFKMTVIHFIIVTIFFFPLSILSGWYPFTARSLVQFFLIFLLVYILFWIISFTINIIRINKINKKLNE